MLEARLARSAHLSATLAAALVDALPRRPHWVQQAVREALVANDAVPADLVGTLVAEAGWEPNLRQHLWGRRDAATLVPGLLPRTARVDVLADAVQHSSSTADEVAQVAMQQRPDSIKVAAAVVANRQVSRTLRTSAAHLVVSGSAPRQADLDWVADVVLNHSRDEAVSLVTSLRAAARAPDARDYLDRVLRSPERGSDAWLSHPGTPSTAIMDWAGSRADLQRALRLAPDLDGNLAASILADREDRGLAATVLHQRKAPLRVLQWAATQLQVPSDQTGKRLHAVADLVRIGSVDWAVSEATSSLDLNRLNLVMQRPDLRGEHLRALDRAMRRLAEGADDRVQLPPDPFTVEWWRTLTLHPNAPADLAHDTALRLLATKHTRSCEVAYAALDSHTRSPAWAAGRVWVRTYSDPALRSVSGLDHLVDLFVHERLRTLSPAQASALVGLAPAFTGTLAELADVAASVTA